MKTVEGLIEENQNLINSFGSNPDRESKEYKKAQKTVAYNNIMIAALRTGITQEKIQADLDKLISKKQRIADNFKKWQANTPHIHQTKNPRAKYDRENEVDKIKGQISFLEDLLG